MAQHIQKLRKQSLPFLDLTESDVGLKQQQKWIVHGARRTLADDFQHMGIEMDWIMLSGLVVSVYVLVSLVFAIGFYVLLESEFPHFTGELNDNMSDFEECFWMSVAHVVTIGYGGIVPSSRAALFWATLEHFAGILLSSLLLGIVVTKASIPTAKLVFSNVLLFSKRNGERVVVFRVVNTRGNFLLHPEVKGSFFRHVSTREGENIYIGSPIVFEEPPVMAPCFNLTHRITEDSPFYGMSEEEIIQADGKLGASFAAVDDHSLQTLYARKLWNTRDFRFNQRFADVLKDRKHGIPVVDMSSFHEFLPLGSQVDTSQPLESAKGGTVLPKDKDT